MTYQKFGSAKIEWWAVVKRGTAIVSVLVPIITGIYFTVDGAVHMVRAIDDSNHHSEVVDAQLKTLTESGVARDKEASDAKALLATHSGDLKAIDERTQRIEAQGKTTNDQLSQLMLQLLASNNRSARVVRPNIDSAAR